MESIGILYIATGPYILYWEEFYQSFRERFLPDMKKTFFVFTDAEEICGQDAEDVKKVYIGQLPWPLITLLRFDIFLKIKDDLSQMDYLMFSNANAICSTVIKREEFLPRKEKGERLFATLHPGYYNKKNIEKPFEHNPKSTAYMPWNRGRNYVIGALFGGTSGAFLAMAETLGSNVRTDLKNRVIAVWHDESHLNCYMAGRKDVRLLTPEYYCPSGWKMPFSPKITALTKSEKFDVNAFKEADCGEVKKTRNKKNFMERVDKHFPAVRYLWVVRDSILKR